MNKSTGILIGFVIGCSLLFMAAVPEWIQYHERVVGENSPYYTDVVNRPAKQIWGNFTSQHGTNGDHKAFIFPTAIPTVPFPTPLPTSTPVTIPTPLPTATPGPDFPTPLPTATPGPDFPTPLPTATPGPDFPTPLPTATPGPDFPTPLPTATPGPDFPTPLPTATPDWNILLHPDDYEKHYTGLWSGISVTSLPATLSTAYCHGAMVGITVPGTFTLPTLTEIVDPAYCTEVRIVVWQTAGALTINAGSGTVIIAPGISTATHLVSTAPHVGSVVVLHFAPQLSKWVVISMVGTWTAS